MAAETSSEEEQLAQMRAENARLRAAIQKVLADEESAQGGWGPDVTMVTVLRDALGTTVEPAALRTWAVCLLDTTRILSDGTFPVLLQGPVAFAQPGDRLKVPEFRLT